MLSVWFRVIRVRFLLSSVLAVSASLAINWWLHSSIDVFDAALTMGGVMALHASVDLLNDYWDFKRGIDTKTQRTGMSGGTGVLPEGLLQPAQVYRAGIMSLAAGVAVGAYFVVTDGFVIAVLLIFAVVSIYFYSTKIVDSGLAEIFVAIKGTCIVLGAYYIQAGDIPAPAALGGVVIGILSAMVLLITSFPDHDADRSQGRKTLVVAWGRRRAARVFWIFPAAAYGVVLISVAADIFPPPVLITLLAAPIVLWSGIGLQKSFNDVGRIVPVMSATLKFSRLAGALLVAGFLLS